MKVNLKDTLVGRSSNIGTHATAARRFLVENVDDISFDRDTEVQLFRTRDVLVKTVISELYMQAGVEGKHDIFTLLSLDHTAKIPSWFLISWLDIDVLELDHTDKSSYHILSSIPKYKDKVLVDITPYYSRSKNSIINSGDFYSRIVRNLLTRSYSQSNSLWLSPTLIYLLAKIYSTVLSNKLGRIYNLSIQEQYVITTIFVVYFVNACSTETDLISPLLGKMDFVNKATNVRPIYDHLMESYDSTNFNIAAVVGSIVELGPARMSGLTISTLMSMYSTLYSNQLISLLAVEYPPYFAYIVLAAMSGEKTNIHHTMKLLNLKRETVELQNEIMKTASFIRKL